MLHHITLQGVIILFFHVVRNEKVWSKICSQFTAIRQKTLSSTFWSEVVCSEFKHLLVIKQHINLIDDNRSLLRVDLLHVGFGMYVRPLVNPFRELYNLCEAKMAD